MSEVPNGTITEWTDTQWDNFSFWLEDLLRSETIEVIFTKADGTERVMQCTKKTSIVNEGIKALEAKRSQEVKEETVAKPKKNKAPSKVGNITVWDVDAGDWRSFRIRSLTNVLTLVMKYDYREPAPLTWTSVEV